MKDEDSKQLVFWIIILTLVVTGVVAIVLNFKSFHDSEMVYDSASGVSYSNETTGAQTDTMIALIGSENIQSLGIDVDVNVKSTLTIRRFLSNAYPQAVRMSYRKDSAKKTDDGYYYELSLNTGEKLSVMLRDLGQKNYSLSISDKNNEIFTYESRDYISVKRDPETLGKNFLPKYFLDVDPIVSVTMDKRGKYFINSNNCGDEAKKQEALKLVNAWLEENGFDSSDFTFEISTYCDEEM